MLLGSLSKLINTHIQMKKICWLTADNFLDVDLPIIKELSNTYSIEWLIYISKHSVFFTKENLSSYISQGYEKVNITIIYSQYRYRNIKMIIVYSKIAKYIKKRKYDLVYINMLGMPYMFIIFYLYRLKNIIYACHDFIDHLNIKKRKFIQTYKKIIFKTTTRFHFFSQTQYRLFNQIYPNKKSFQASLCLKDFGHSNLRPDQDKIIFTFFGGIRENKGLNYLIEAGNLLEEKYHNKFIIRIYGYHPDWENTYGKMINNHSAFQLNICRIPNNQIAHLMCSTHFLVLPYLDVTQSGPLLIAYNYNTPCIASDLEGFREYINDKETGYLFKSQDAKSLAKVMSYTIENKEKYHKIKEKLNIFIKDNLSTRSIAKKYIEYFDTFNNL